MTDKKEIELNEDEKKAMAEGLKESAELLDQVEKLDKNYEKLSKKHPLKTKTSTYQD